MMENNSKTKRFSATEIEQAAKLLRQGELVAFPTETVYGLGANGLNPQAVKRIFAAKGRPADNPLILHIATPESINQLTARLPKLAQKLIEQFWPGPLTLVLPKADKVPEVTTAALDTVAVRMPKHQLALELIEESQMPLAAPSANLSGRPSPTLARHVLEDLDGRIDAVVDGGPTGIGVESTVVNCSKNPPVLLRPGAITYEQLTAVVEELELAPEVSVADLGAKPSSPGMKYKHYSPQAEVIVVTGTLGQITAKVNSLVAESKGSIGIMATAETIDCYQSGSLKTMGSRKDLREISSNLFKLLRDFDREKVDKIVVEGVPETGVGVAIMNRLHKAADKIYSLF